MLLVERTRHLAEHEQGFLVILDAFFQRGHTWFQRLDAFMVRRDLLVVRCDLLCVRVEFLLVALQAFLGCGDARLQRVDLLLSLLTTSPEIARSYLEVVNAKPVVIDAGDYSAALICNTGQARIDFGGGVIHPSADVRNTL